MILYDWSMEGCPFNTVCDIINSIMSKADLNNMVSFVIKAGAGEIDYEHE